MPSIDLVRIRDGKAYAVNIKEGYDDPDVSARAGGFKAIIDKFQDKVSVLTNVSTIAHSLCSSLTWTFQSMPWLKDAS